MIEDAGEQRIPVVGGFVRCDLIQLVGVHVLAVAIHDPEFNSFHEADELPPHKLAMIRRFFQDYKTLEGKAVEVDELTSAKTAFPIILESLERYSLSRRRGFR